MEGEEENGLKKEKNPAQNCRVETIIRCQSDETKHENSPPPVPMVVDLSMKR